VRVGKPCAKPCVNTSVSMIPKHPHHFLERSHVNHDTHPQVAAIDAQLRDLESAKTAAEGDRARTALAAMTDKTAAKKLVAIEAELAGYITSIDRATAARRAAVEQAAADFGQHKADVLAQNIADALAASKQRVESAARIEKAIAALGQALEQHNASGVLAWSALSKCSALVGGIGVVLPLMDSAVGNGAATAATVALHNAITRANDLGGARVHVSFPGINTSAVGTAVEGARLDLERIESMTANWTVADEPAAPRVQPDFIAGQPLIPDGKPQRTQVIDGTTRVIA
jgi:hypothetical protein